MNYEVKLHHYNVQALERGLASEGMSLEDFSKEDIGIMLSHALGYCDFTNPGVINEMLIQVQNERWGNR